MTFVDPKTFAEFDTAALAWFPAANAGAAPAAEGKDAVPAPRHGRIFPVTWPERERASA